MVYSIYYHAFYSGAWVFVHSFSSLAYCKKYVLKHFRNDLIRITRHKPFEDPVKVYDFVVESQGRDGVVIRPLVGVSA